MNESQITTSGMITAEEMNAILLWGCRQVQQSTFKEEYSALTKNKNVNRYSPVLAVAQWLDQNMRVGCGLKNAEITLHYSKSILNN